MKKIYQSPDDKNLEKLQRLMVKNGDSNRFENKSVNKMNNYKKLRLMADSRVVSEFASRSKMSEIK